jgi:vacuolar-type H+-ATPase subunit I/STV1
MATDKKHIAVYLDPAVEAALIAFCQEKGLKSKKGFMYSAGVNAALAAFFGIADIDNILQSSSNIPNPTASNTPDSVTSNIPTESIDIEVLPGKPDSLTDSEAELLRQELEEAKAENKRWEEAFNELEGERDDLDTILQELRSQLEALKAENEVLRTVQPVANFELPEAPDLLNQLKAKRKKATASLADIEAILEILEELTPVRGN